jgi:hypothetical protein
MKLSAHTSLRIALVGLTAMCLVISSCKKKKDDEVTPIDEETETPTFRVTKIDYNVLTSTTPYNNTYFVNSTGDSTVDRLDGQNRLRMLRAIDAYAKLPNNASSPSQVDATVLENMFANVGSPFSGVYADLNTSTLNVREITALSKSTNARDAVIDQFSTYFTALDNASASINDSAFAGQAGRLTNGSSKYLLDGKGIEYAQIISKSFIGATLMDYISNGLLDEGLNADNTKEVAGKKYTELEHNWDVAYGLLTLKSYYGKDVVTTVPESSGGETFLGSYVWEYCRTADDYTYTKLHPAFLKGRAAIVNNDMTEVKAQAAIIRSILEKAIARAAVGYMGKWSTGATPGSKAHAIGEGGGFIYSLRFCYLNGADDAFSNDILNDLGLYTGDGFWDLTAPKVNGAAADITTKFGL